MAALNLKKAYAGCYFANTGSEKLGELFIMKTCHAKEDASEKGWSIRFCNDMECDYSYNNLETKKDAIEIAHAIVENYGK